MPWALVEVRGGVADLDFKDCTALLVDWDNIGDDMHDAQNTLDALAEMWTGLATDDVKRIRDTILDLWPDLREHWDDLRSQWTPGLQQREASL